MKANIKRLCAIYLLRLCAWDLSIVLIAKLKESTSDRSEISNHKWQILDIFVYGFTHCFGNQQTHQS